MKLLSAISRPSARPSRPRRARRLFLEGLERRELFAVDLSFIDLDTTSQAAFDATARVDGKLVFYDVDPEHGFEPRIYDPQTNVVSLLADINPGPADSRQSAAIQPEGFAVVGTKVYFVAFDGTSHQLRWIDVADAGHQVHTPQVPRGIL